MNKATSLLKDIQDLDTRIIKEKNCIEKIPQQIVEFEHHFHEVKREFEKKRKDLDVAMKERKEHEDDLDDVTEKINKLKSRIAEIKTNKEYQAHLKEIESVEEQKSSVEDEILLAMDRVDEIKNSLNLLEERLNVENSKIDEKMALLKKDQEDAKKELDHLLLKRDDLSKAMDSDLYNQYMHLLENKNARAVSRVKEEVCMGCNMSIPPQTYAEVIKNDRLIKCPQCGRFLYYEPEGKEENPSNPPAPS